MKINSAASATSPALPSVAPKGLTKPAQGHAYGVLKKLETDHYHANAQARLMAKFGHLLPTTDTSVPPAADTPPATDTGTTTPTDTTTDAGTGAITTTSGATDSSGSTLDVVA